MPGCRRVDGRVARLRWRCRRGMRELDALLQAFVETQAEALGESELTTFEEILELPDPVLHAYLLERDAPDDAAAVALLKRIRASLGANP